MNVFFKLLTNEKIMLILSSQFIFFCAIAQSAEETAIRKLQNAQRRQNSKKTLHQYMDEK
jgi:hypothetical protein